MSFTKYIFHKYIFHFFYMNWSLIQSIALFHLIIVSSHDWLYRGNCVARYSQHKLLRSIMLRNLSLVAISRNFSRTFSFTLMQNNYIPRMLSRSKIRESFIPHSFLLWKALSNLNFLPLTLPSIFNAFFPDASQMRNEFVMRSRNRFKR